MQAEAWQRIKKIFVEVAPLDPEKRSERLDELCCDDPLIRDEVEALLVSDSDAGDFIEESALSLIGLSPAQSPNIVGRQIGHYRIIREIGRGGMGAVFLAERSDGEFEQKVAIKILGSAFPSREAIKRFRQERQILARLEHPNIARLLDGGVSEDGLPYLVMEYVEGNRLLEHADELGLDIEKRLTLFLEVCRAVSYAHHNLIVHRDLKPSNVIVTPDGEVKLLDFGLAKILDLDHNDVTATNFRALTPAYAPPEQLSGGPITAASDVYSLGVVLYELLTGTRPYDHDSMALNKLLDPNSGSGPLKPSAKVVEKTRQDSDRAAQKQSRLLAGDLDAIVLTAIRLEPERRYGSVEQLSSDIIRHLGGLPITAAEDSFSYRTSKFIRRHVIGVASAATIALLLIGGIFATAWQANVAAAERDQAKSERDKTEQLNTFLQSILSAAAPQSKGKNASVLEVLDDAALRIEKEFTGQPELKAISLTTIGHTYNKLGLPQSSEVRLREACSILADLHPGYDKHKVMCMLYLAESLVLQSKFDEAEGLWLQAIGLERNEFPSGSEARSFALFGLGEIRVRQRRYPEAETILAESIAICEAIPDPVEADCPYYKLSLARSKLFSGDLDGAEPILTQLIDIFRSQPKRPPTDLADVQTNLGDLLLSRANFEEALGPLAEAERTYEKELGDSLNLVIARFYLSRAHFGLKHYDQALSFSRSAIEIAERIKWMENRNYVGSLLTAGRSLLGLKRLREAEVELRKANEIGNRVLSVNDPRRIEIGSALGQCLLELGQRTDARSHLMFALEAAASQYGPEDPRTVELRRLVEHLKSGSRS